MAWYNKTILSLKVMINRCIGKKILNKTRFIIQKKKLFHLNSGKKNNTLFF